MKLIIFITFVSTFLGCQDNRTNFEIVECNTLDSITNKNLRQVFKPCRQYIYQAKYWDSEYNLISDELIWMMATGKGWEVQPELQDELKIQYDYDSSKISFIESFNINLSLADREWSKKETTGIIETESQIWMHPFRQNQYCFNEVAAFPQIILPMEEGKSWESKLNIHGGWGDWDNTILNTTYQILNLETINIPFKKIDAWHVRAITIAAFGNSQHDFWFNEEFGFVKMIIKNYKGQFLAIELKEVIEG